MKEYLSSCEEVLKEQNSSEQGLSTGEAQQRLSRFGKNELEKGKKKSWHWYILFVNICIMEK